MAMAIEADVREILTPEREEIIRQAYKAAWEDWIGSPDRSKRSRWPRTRANDLFEYAANHIFAGFAVDAGAHFIFHRETYKLFLDNRLVIRFKYGNQKGLGSNVDTRQISAFCDPQVDLPGMTGVQKIEVDYMLNATETAITQILVVARNNKKSLWSYAINGTGGAAVIPLSLPQQPAPSVDEMVVPRKAKQDKKAGKGQG